MKHRQWYMGQQKINNQWYYFDKITGAMKLGYYWIAELQIQKEVYYDLNKGNMVYGQQKLCYYDGLGNMVYGWQTINGQKDYFNTVTGAYETPTSEIASYRDDVASQINAILKNEGKNQWTLIGKVIQITSKLLDYMIRLN